MEAGRDWIGLEIGMWRRDGTGLEIGMWRRDGTGLDGTGDRYVEAGTGQDWR